MSFITMYFPGKELLGAIFVDSVLLMSVMCFDLLLRNDLVV